jgi:hypothetical protein
MYDNDLYDGAGISVPRSGPAAPLQAQLPQLHTPRASLPAWPPAAAQVGMGTAGGPHY